MEVLYKSTRSHTTPVTASQAILKGLAEDGGLFVPDHIPTLEVSMKELSGMTYQEVAYEVMKLYLTDFTEDELKGCINKAYDKKFDTDVIAPLAYADGAYYLELFHGATIAFKDMALQILPYFLTTAMKKLQLKEKIVILVATSGDTGKAALEGFKDVEHTKIVVFYPVDGVSPMQKHQMNTQEGENVRVCAIKGNFDDAQTGVKKIFTTPSVAEKLAENNMLFSSANSINWGRLLPQIVYYISAYCDLVNDGKIELGDKINVVVPTGNFGNILASYYASLMGLPINKFICASNSNNVLTDFIKTGVYDKNRNFYTTISPSMDILVSSNLERLLYKLSGDNDEVTRGWMNALKSEGKYEVSDDVKAVINEKFYGGFCDDKNTEATIHEMFEQDKYLCDTHTAVAINVYKQYVEETGDKTPSVIASTASPYKFSNAVLEAVEPNATLPETEFDMVDELHKVSGAEVPAPLANLKNKTARFSDVTEVNDMENYVLGALGID